MIEEESIYEVSCPFCGEVGSCDHLLAVFDMSFLSLNGGALMGRLDSICARAGELAVRRLRAESDVLQRLRHPNLKDLFADVKFELQYLAQEPPDASVPSVNAGRGHIIYLCNEILPDLDVEQPWGSVYDGDMPGYSSVMKVFWARKPAAVLDQLEERLVEMVAKKV